MSALALMRMRMHRAESAHAAPCSGVAPWSLRWLTFALLCSSSAVQSAWPLAAAKVSAEFPCSPLASMSFTLRASRSVSSGRLPCSAASHTGGIG
eukprot:5083189-Prymnesium_polylepis.1